MTQGRLQSGPAATISTSSSSMVTAPAASLLRRRSVIAEQPWFKAAPVERRQQVARAVTTARATAARNRRLVLGHPDLAEQLVRRLGYTRPDVWSGYVPPRWFESGGITGERWIPNDSPVRAVLVELVAEAETRAVAS